MTEFTKESYNTLPFKVWHNAEKRWLNNEEMEEAVELKMDYGRAWIELKDHDKYEIVTPYNDYIYMPDENTNTPIDCQFCEKKALPSEMKIEENGIILCSDCYDDDDDTLKNYLETDVEKPEEQQENIENGKNQGVHANNFKQDKQDFSGDY